MSNLPEAQGAAVHVQLKLSKLHVQLKSSKQRNPRRQKTKKQTKPTQQTKAGVGG